MVSGDTSAPADPTPELTAHVDTLYDSVELVIAIRDADGDIEGGTLAWSDGGGPGDPLAIPNDLDRWNPLTGEAVILLDEAVPVDCTGASVERTYTVQITDVAGNQSAPEEAALHIRVLDAGRPRGNARTALGDVTAPVMLCGTLDPLDSAAKWRLVHRPGGPWTIEFTASDTNVDLRLTGEVGNTEIVPGGSAVVTLVDGANVNLDVNRIGPKGDTVHYQVWMHR